MGRLRLDRILFNVLMENEGTSVPTYTQRVKATNPIAYWTMGDASGAVAVDEMGLANAVYNNVTLGQAGIGDGKTSVACNASYINNYSAALAAAINFDEISIQMWVKVPAYPDTQYLARIIGTDSEINLKLTTAGFAVNYMTTNLYYVTTSTDWQHLMLTVSKSGDAANFYIDGALVWGPETSLGTFTGPLDSLYTGIASLANFVALNGLVGNLAHFAIWTRALTPTEVAGLASPFDHKQILVLGDSKSITNGYPSKLLHDLNDTTYPSIKFMESTPRIATGGWKAADLHTAVDATIATVTPAPNYALVNIGINDWETWSTDEEAAWKAQMQGIIDGIHGQFPACQIYILRPWSELDTVARLLQYANQLEWIDELVTLNSSCCHLGPNEADFLTGLTVVDDWVHPTEPEGYQATADAWRAAIGY